MFYRTMLIFQFYTLLLILDFISYANGVTVCKQTLPSTDKENLKYCCCRTLNRNTTSNETFVYLNSTNIVNVTGKSEQYFDITSTSLKCFVDSANISSTIVQQGECHCSTNYVDLLKYRNSENSTFKCSWPKFTIGGFFDLHSVEYMKIKEAIYIALEEVNSDPKYFPQYEMAVQMNISTVNVSVDVRSVFNSEPCQTSTIGFFAKIDNG